MSQSDESAKTETTFPFALRGVSRSNQEWLREQGIDADTIISLYRCRHENRDLYESILTSAADTTTLKLLKALSLSHRPLTYNDLTDFTTTTERTVRTKVNDLADRGIVDKSRSKPVNVTLTETAEILTKDVLTNA